MTGRVKAGYFAVLLAGAVAVVVTVAVLWPVPERSAVAVAATKPDSGPPFEAMARDFVRAISVGDASSFCPHLPARTYRSMEWYSVQDCVAEAKSPYASYDVETVAVERDSPTAGRATLLVGGTRVVLHFQLRKGAWIFVRVDCPGCAPQGRSQQGRRAA